MCAKCMAFLSHHWYWHYHRFSWDGYYNNNNRNVNNNDIRLYLHNFLQFIACPEQVFFHFQTCGPSLTTLESHAWASSKCSLCLCLRKCFESIRWEQFEFQRLLFLFYVGMAGSSTLQVLQVSPTSESLQKIKIKCNLYL